MVKYATLKKRGESSSMLTVDQVNILSSVFIRLLWSNELHYLTAATSMIYTAYYAYYIILHYTNYSEVMATMGLSLSIRTARAVVRTETFSNSCSFVWSAVTRVWRQTWPRWLEMQVMTIWYMLQEGSLTNAQQRQECQNNAQQSRRSALQNSRSEYADITCVFLLIVIHVGQLACIANYFKMLSGTDVCCVH